MTGSSGPGDPVGEFLDSQVSRGSMPGAAWWTGPAEEPVSTGVAGWATLEPRREPLTRDTPFDLASLTKPLATATLAALAEAEGALSLDDPLERWLPELRPGPYAEVTLRWLGAHRGGLPAWAPLYLEASDRDGYLARLATREPAGSRRATLYSDLSYLLLGFALERATGASLDRLFRERIAVPLGLSRAGFAVPGADYSDAAATERGNEHERGMAGPAGDGHPWRRHVLRGEVHDVNAWTLGGAAGNAGLFATLDDVVRMTRAILEPSKLGIPDSARDLWLRPVEGPGTRTFGWLPSNDADSARGIFDPDAVGHFGFTGTSIWIEPGRRSLHILLTNRVHPRVPEASFAPVRLGFHRVAAECR